VRWPVNAQHPQGTQRLYEDLKFWTGIDDCESYGADFLTGNKHTRDEYARIDPKGKAFLRPARWRQMPNPTTKEYPFALTTGRVVYHWHTRTKTARSAALNQRAPHAYVEVHPDDATRLGIQLGDLVEITSPNGVWEGPALVVDTVRPGLRPRTPGGQSAHVVHEGPCQPATPAQVRTSPAPAQGLRRSQAVDGGAPRGPGGKIPPALCRPRHRWHPDAPRAPSGFSALNGPYGAAHGKRRPPSPSSGPNP
jgi:anaerobic selenocysteine-containing dehydrogenase